MAKRPTLVEYFSEVCDPRVERARLHQVSDILALSLCAVLCGADHFTEIENFGRAKEGWLRSFLDLPHGIPSHDTLGRVFARLDPDALRACFLRWLEALREGLQESLPDLSEGVIAIDGKTLRRSFDRASEKGPLHMLSAWASAARMVVGQVKTSEKSNEITAIPVLLDLLDVLGCVVTIDAMGCQKEIARKIRSLGADYVFSLKGNHTYLADDVKAYFIDAKERGFANRPVTFFETRDYEHGRTEVRRYYASCEVEWLLGRDAQTSKPAAEPDEGDWDGLQSIVMVESERTVGERTTRIQRYYITSLPNDAQRIAHAIRAHWSIENQLHWSLDVSFSEDACRVRKDNAPHNLALLRHIALNLLQHETTARMGLKAKRLKAAWDNDYLLKILAT